jgi:hypothetical protein
MPALPVSQLHEIISIARTLPWNASQLRIAGSFSPSTSDSHQVLSNYTPTHKSHMPSDLDLQLEGLKRSVDLQIHLSDGNALSSSGLEQACKGQGTHPCTPNAPEHEPSTVPHLIHGDQNVASVSPSGLGSPSAAFTAKAGHDNEAENSTTISTVPAVIGHFTSLA